MVRRGLAPASRSSFLLRLRLQRPLPAVRWRSFGRKCTGLLSFKICHKTRIKRTYRSRTYVLAPAAQQAINNARPRGGCCTSRREHSTDAPIKTQSLARFFWVARVGFAVPSLSVTCGRPRGWATLSPSAMTPSTRAVSDSDPLYRTGLNQLLQYIL